MSSKNAAKWCVMWPYFVFDLENAQFHHFFRNFIRTSGSNICWPPNKYFWNKCKKCFNLSYNLDQLSLIFLLHIMTVRKVKIFLTVSRDSSTDRQQKANSVLINSTLSDERVKSKNSNHYLSSETRTKFLTFWEFCEKKMHWCTVLSQLNARENIKLGILDTCLERDPENCFWVLSVIRLLMTS